MTNDMQSVQSIVPHLSSMNVMVYERLKVMISQRELKAGTRLVQQQLAKKMGTSVMPVIEALRRLERDGWVIHVPHLGNFVKETTVKEVCEAYCVRRALEVEACWIFVERASDKDKQKLRELNEVLNAAARSHDVATYLEADLKFHMHIVTGARVERLRTIIENGHVEEKVFANAPELQTGGTTAHLIGLHDEIVAAVERGDAAGAALAMRKHLQEAEKQYLEVVHKKQEGAA